MIQALMEFGNVLQIEKKLSPVGYYRPKEKIRWIIHVFPNDDMRFVIQDLKKDGLDMSRPTNGRTNKKEPLPLTDEAAYVFGVKGNKEKHDRYLELVSEIMKCKYPWLKEAAEIIYAVITNTKLKNAPEILKMKEKEWVTFVIEKEGFKDFHLFEHQSMLEYWSEYVQKLKSSKISYSKKLSDTQCTLPIKGICSICGQNRPLVLTMKKPKFAAGTPPLHSLNSNAFVSYYDGSDASDKTHLGICFECSELAADALTYMSNHREHYKHIYRDKKKGDSLKNQIAYFWILPDDAMQTENNDEFDLDAFSDLSMPLDSFESKTKQDLIDESRIDRALKAPWSGKVSTDFSSPFFHLMLLSPNGSGRISPRLHLSHRLGQLQRSLQIYANASMICDSFGQKIGFFGLAQVLEALDAEGSSQYANTNLVTAMLRCCYEGHSPPQGILMLALQHFGLPLNQEQKQNPSKLWQYNRKQHILASVIKLALAYDQIKNQTKGETWMQTLNENSDARTQPERYGMLLAVMEEVQRQAAGGRVNASIVDSFYKSASTMPEMAFGTLFPRIEDRLSQLRKKYGVTDIEKEMESLTAEIAENGGFAPSLEVNEQAEFALGFYHMRAAYRAKMISKSKNRSTQ
jgi:CRISPR-associated protein Csd1